MEVLRRHHQPAGHDAVAHDLAGPVHVGEEAFECQHPLAHAPLDGRPFGGGDDSGYEVEWEWPFLLSREREGHASIGKHAVPHPASLVEVGSRQRLDLLEQGPVVSTRQVTAFQHLVPTGVEPVAVEEVAHDDHLCGRSVTGRCRARRRIRVDPRPARHQCCGADPAIYPASERPRYRSYVGLVHLDRAGELEAHHAVHHGPEPLRDLVGVGAGYERAGRDHARRSSAESRSCAMRLIARSSASGENCGIGRPNITS